MKPNFWRHALAVMALLPLSLAVYAQTPSAAPPGPPAGTSAAAAPAANAPAPATTAKLSKEDSDTLKAASAASVTGEGASRADTAWMIVATALVMFMTPGLALFYGGLVRSKNILNTLMMSFVALGIISVQWMLFGYSIAFGNDIPISKTVAGIIGDPRQFLGLHGVGGWCPFRFDNS